MATERLYRTRSYDRSFSSAVLRRIPEGDYDWLVLARTLFYPASGGQPSDLGTLGGQAVVKVKNEGDEVWHRLERPAARAGDTVTGGTVRGVLDWPRRYRHMQRHSGQHLLSQAFLRVNPGFTTESVSLSGPVCTADLAGEPAEGDVAEAERVVNEAVYANYPIQAFEVSGEDISDYPLRRPPKVSGRVRLVRMGDWELSACGGTHLRATAEAGPVKVLRLERVRGGLSRVHFCCGLEAVEDYRLKHRVSYTLAAQLSSQVAEVPERVASLQDELGLSKRQRAGLQNRLASHLAQSLLDRAEPGPQGRVVVCALSADEADLLKPLAQLLAQEPDVIALLGSVQEDKTQLLFSRGQAVAADMNALLKAALPFVAGRGGGRPDLAQGGGTHPGGLEQALGHARAQLS